MVGAGKLGLLRLPRQRTPLCPLVLPPEGGALIQGRVVNKPRAAPDPAEERLLTVGRIQPYAQGKA
jgi:hypothetical protein